jgi:hypothetical protein
MGDAMIGAGAGPGCVRVIQAEERWNIHLNEAGRNMAAALAAPIDN